MKRAISVALVVAQIEKRPVTVLFGELVEGRFLGLILERRKIQ
jgi:hypothetical protein